MSVCIFKQLFYHLHYFYLVLFPALPVLLQSFSGIFAINKNFFVCKVFLSSIVSIIKERYKSRPK